MASGNNPLPSRNVQLTLEVPEEHLPAFEQLLLIGALSPNEPSTMKPRSGLVLRFAEL